MPFVPFHDLCPEIAMRETRVLTVLPGADVPLPPAQYSFVEMFCDESDCDCRRAFFTVYSSPGPKTEAVISWGWENAAFYKRWFGFGDTQLIETMRGPILEIGSPVSRNAKYLLQFFTTVLLADPMYAERVKKHYAMFRTAIDSGAKRQRATEPDRDSMPVSSAAISAGSGGDRASLTRTRQQPEARQRVGRNDPCLCGSGKKFKNCCLK
jgi:SEC-C motif